MKKSFSILCMLIVSVELSIGQNLYSEDLMNRAIKGNAKAQYEIGMAYANGNGVTKDFNTGLKWIEKSANQGYLDAQYTIGEIYCNSQNYVKGAQWWQRASDNGDLDATYNLAVLYKMGYGVEKDMSKSLKLLTKAAEKGHVSAMYNLGNYYQRGDGVAQDWSKCFFWRKKAADKGDGAACYNLAIDYTTGTPALNKDYKLSIEYINKAVEIGYPIALFVQGEAFYEGSYYAEGKKDYSKAVTLLNKFLEKTDEMDMDNEWMGTTYLILSKCYRFGRGTKTNIPKANLYYNKAKAYGVTDENVDKIIKELRGF